jgi:diguanylate cyclase (GGDEF)-like protein
MKHRSSPELLRARYRVLFFLALTLCTLAAGGHLALAAAACGLAAAALSLRVAIAQGPALSVSFIAIDWLVLGLLLAAASGVRGSLVAAIPLLAFTELAPATPREHRLLLAPAAAMVVVLLIADPSLGGHRTLSLLELIALVAAGAVPAVLLGRLRGAAWQKARRRQRPPSVDPATGFSTLQRLTELLGQALRDAAAGHEALSVVCVRLDHFEDTRTFLGPERAEAIVAGVARRVKRRLQPDDLAFRVSRDTFVVCLRGRLPREARNDAAGLQHDVAIHLVDRHRQTVSTGIAAFPAARSVEELLRGAHLDLQRGEAQLRAAAQ